MVIFWGSQSGKSQRFANVLARECHARYGINAISADLDDYDHKHFSEFAANKIAIFIVATYGEGDPTDNANSLSEYLTSLKSETSTSLTSLRFLAYGLGNSSYRLYNKFVAVVDEKLQAAGAERLGYVGKGDAAGGTTATENSFSDWKREMLHILGEKLGREERAMTYEPGLDVLEACSLEQADVYLGEPGAQHLKGSPKTNINLQNPYAAPIALSKELFTTGDRNCIHMEFDISGAPSLKYQSGDHLAVWPINPDDEVERLIRVLGWDEATRHTSIDIQAKERTTKVPIPSPTTRETVLKYYLEICGPVSHDLVGLLRDFAPSPDAKQVLEDLYGSWRTVGQELSSKYLNTGKLMQFAGGNATWSKVPLTLLIESMPKVQPRYYSIASSPTVAARRPAITAVVNASPPAPTPSDPVAERFHGVATNYLLAHKRHQHGEEPAEPGRPSYTLDGPRGKLAGSKVLMHVRTSAFKLPTNPSRPIIMVGAGTGVAPFRGFLQERAKLASYAKEVGQMLLLFGCRSPSEDFLYEDEWREYERTVPLELVTAFSRADKEEKVYVQQRLAQRKQDVVRMLVDNHAYFYICGSAHMGADVRAALLDALVELKSWSLAEAERYLRTLKASKRLQEDVWVT